MFFPAILFGSGVESMHIWEFGTVCLTALEHHYAINVIIALIKSGPTE